MTNSPLALYVHWPWCLRKCPYCDFNVYTHSKISKNQYVNALLADLNYQAKKVGKRPLTSVFFGGGTPSLMAPAHVAELLHFANKLFPFDRNCEITLEINPETITANYLKSLTDAGVNRFSLGVQAWDDTLLQTLGRQHTEKQAKKSLDLALKACDNVSLDLIYGHPQQTLENWEKQLNYATQLPLQHMSCYQLTIEPNTLFGTQVKRGLWSPLADDDQALFFSFTKNSLEKQGFINYEISNFAHPNMASQHNVHVWRYGDYLGIGAGAHGRLTDTCGNKFSTRHYRQPHTYANKISSDTPFIEFTPLTQHNQAQEAVLLGLRLAEGVDIENIEKQAQTSLHEEVFNQLGLSQMLQLNFLKQEGSHLQLTPAGWPFLDSILEQIIM